jgi:hypothetical protein
LNKPNIALIADGVIRDFAEKQNGKSFSAKKSNGYIQVNSDQADFYGEEKSDRMQRDIDLGQQLVS